MTRRATLVAVLRGGNGYSLQELNAMQAVKGVSEFLIRAASLGITNTQLADRLVAFKTNGGSGIASAVAAITKEWDTPAPAVTTAKDDCKDTVVKVLQAAIDTLNAG